VMAVNQLGGPILFKRGLANAGELESPVGRAAPEPVTADFPAT